MMVTMSDDMCLLHLPGHMYVPPKELLPLLQEGETGTQSRCPRERLSQKEKAGRLIRSQMVSKDPNGRTTDQEGRLVLVEDTFL